MRALTICQPHAAFIVESEAYLSRLCPAVEHKRIENRTWSTPYRGPMLIHAGTSRQWLGRVSVEVSAMSMTYGAIIGVCDLIDCVEIPSVSYKPGFEWIKQHQHAFGPYGFVLDNVLKFSSPVPFKGRQKWFNVPDEAIASQLGNWKSGVNV